MLRFGLQLITKKIQIQEGEKFIIFSFSLILFFLSFFKNSYI